MHPQVVTSKVTNGTGTGCDRGFGEEIVGLNFWEKRCSKKSILDQELESQILGQQSVYDGLDMNARGIEKFHIRSGAA